jgi:hypothetical protein
MEPMDTKLCVLLELNLINASVVYTQTQICSIIANNQTAFDTIYNDPVARADARNTYLGTAQIIDVQNKSEDCGD